MTASISLAEEQDVYKRQGTYRPYLLLIPLPLSIVSVLLFAAPDLSTTGKIVYAAVLYICYGMLVTAIEIPYYAILPTMSRNEMERNDVISLATFIASIMILIVTSFTTNFVNVIGGDNPAKGYMVLVAIGAILMCITCLLYTSVSVLLHWMSTVNISRKMLLWSVVSSRLW